MGSLITCTGDRVGKQLPCTSRHEPPLRGPGVKELHSSWAGRTVPEWLFPDNRPDASRGPHWCHGDATAFQVRSGPNYAATGSKTASVESLYQCISMDIVRSAGPVYEVLGRLMQVPAQTRQCSWKPECMLPRILCNVTLLPYGLAWDTRDPAQEYRGDEPGCSIVTVHMITSETVKAAMSDNPPASVRLLREWVRDVRAERQCKLGDSATSGILKGIAYIDNPDDIGAPWALMPIVRSYNGKPALITRSGRVFADPKRCEWLEVDVDVRVFSYAARSALYNLQYCLPLASVHVGFTIQGCDDEELPEGIMCCCRVLYVDLVKTAAVIDDPRYSIRMPPSLMPSDSPQGRAKD